jgi:head-tail joining protein
MSFDSFLIHTLVIRRVAATLDGNGEPVLDDYGQPMTGPTTLAEVPGLIQPRSAREIALTSQGGAVIGEHVGFLRPLAGLGTDCWIERDGARYDILTMPDAGGQGHHLELGLKRVS